MKRPLAYITAPWSNNQYENTENAAAYCRQVYDAGVFAHLPGAVPAHLPQGRDSPGT